MRRRTFKVSLLVHKGEKLKNVRDAITHVLTKAYPTDNVKTVIYYEKPWWKRLLGVK